MNICDDGQRFRDLAAVAFMAGLGTLAGDGLLRGRFLASLLNPLGTGTESMLDMDGQRASESLDLGFKLADFHLELLVRLEKRAVLSLKSLDDLNGFLHPLIEVKHRRWILARRPLDCG